MIVASWMQSCWLVGCECMCERNERVEELINNLFDVKHELEGDLETVLNLVDFYIMHYEKLGKRGLAGAMRELQTDINNALNIGDD